LRDSLVQLTGALVKHDHHLDGLFLRPKHLEDLVVTMWNVTR